MFLQISTDYNNRKIFKNREFINRSTTSYLRQVIVTIIFHLFKYLRNIHQTVEQFSVTCSYRTLLRCKVCIL